MTYLKSQADAVTEMNPLQAPCSNMCRPTGQGTPCKSLNALVSQLLAFHEANSAKLGKPRQMPDAFVSQSTAASQVNVSNPLARLDQLDDCIVRQVDTMAQMDEMQILP